MLPRFLMISQQRFHFTAWISRSSSQDSTHLTIAFLYFTYYDVSVKSINCVCARTNKQFILIDTPNTENGIKWCEHAILWEFEVFEDCGNCIAMEQSGYISEWQNLLLTLTSQYIIFHNTIFLRIFLVMLFNKSKIKTNKKRSSFSVTHLNRI